MRSISFWLAVTALGVALGPAGASANAYREKGKAVKVADAIMVTPPRDWNRLDARPGKSAEVWTLDGEQLNDITFFAAIEPGKPLVRERSKKRDPLPKFTGSTLLAEVPELLEGTYRTYKQIAAFTITGSRPDRFLGADGIRYTYEFTDADALPRKGEARAAIIGGKLYMATFDAPRLYYFDRTIGDYRALTDSATLAR